ncbi:MAG: response regulator transcription factor [Nocardioidaceae bacterium]|nr:response regulator transcription factor [Nocardioidaceae bacterium]
MLQVDYRRIESERQGSGVTTRLRLAIVDDFAVVVAGVASFLASEGIDVVETGASTPVISDVDIVFYDPFAQVQGQGIDLKDLVRASRAKVVIYSWNLHPRLIEEAVAAGACGYLSKVLSGPEIVAALKRVLAGQTVILPGINEPSVDDQGDWPGRSLGLTRREAEILALIALGLSNQQIARRLYLSINSIKAYIRTAYRKMGVTSRSQAVLWAVNNGFRPDAMRSIDPAFLRRPPASPVSTR